MNHTSKGRSASHGPARLLGAIALAAALPLACGALQTMGTMAFEAGKDYLVDTARANFQKGYGESIEKLMTVLAMSARQEAATPPSAATAASTAAPAALAPAAVAPAAAAPAAAASAATLAAAPAPAGEVVPPPQALVSSSLDLAVLRETIVAGKLVPAAVADGDVLRDDIGRSEPGDNLKIRISPSADGYVYAVWIDATAWATPVFPADHDAALGNPVKAGQVITIPPGDDWLFLDEHRGVETLYVLYSQQPRPDVDQALRALLGHTRPVTAPDGGALQPATQTAAISRGLGGTRPGRTVTVTTSDGQSQQAPSTLFEMAKGSGDLVITRWFRHE